MLDSFRIELPASVNAIISTLNKNNFDAYAVGGCVRDSILGREPVDWDIATSAEPCQVKMLFGKTIDTGIKHGTVTVVIDRQNFEVTTFREDGKYEDNRRPSSVKFTSSIENDLARRDFTVNAIAYHPEIGLVDPFSGVEDINNKVIRTVGNPDERFREDALRMLRAVRFSAQLDFTVEEGTFGSISRNSPLIANISVERIRDELTRMLVSENPERFALLYETGLIGYIMPEFGPCFETMQKNPYHIYSVAEHILKSVSYIEKDKVLRWVMLLHDIGKPYTKTTDEKGIDHFYGHMHESVIIAEKILKRLHFDNRSVSKICRLIELHDLNIRPDHKEVRKAVNRAGDDIFEELLKVAEADKRAQNPEFLMDKLETIDKIRSIYREIKQKGQCVSLKGLDITGDDLIKAGIREGKRIKVVLEKLLEKVLDDPELNKKDRLLELAERYIEKRKV